MGPPCSEASGLAPWACPRFEVSLACLSCNISSLHRTCIFRETIPHVAILAKGLVLWPNFCTLPPPLLQGGSRCSHAPVVKPCDETPRVCQHRWRRGAGTRVEPHPRRARNPHHSCGMSLARYSGQDHALCRFMSARSARQCPVTAIMS